MNIVSKAIAAAIESEGSQVKAGRRIGVSQAAISRWMSEGRLPRTEFTGETDYSKTLAILSGVQHDKILKASQKAWKQRR